MKNNPIISISRSANRNVQIELCVFFGRSRTPPLVCAINSILCRVHCERFDFIGRATRTIIRLTLRRIRHKIEFLMSSSLSVKGVWGRTQNASFGRREFDKRKVSKRCVRGGERIAAGAATYVPNE